MENGQDVQDAVARADRVSGRTNMDVRTLSSEHPVLQHLSDWAGAPVAFDPQLIITLYRGWSVNTRRAFLSDVRIWESWCRGHDLSPAYARPEDVVRFLREASAPYLLDDQGRVQRTDAGRRIKNPHHRALSTLTRLLTHIAMAYRMLGMESPTKTDLVRLEMKALRRERGAKKQQARALRYKGDVSDLAHDVPQGLCIANIIAHLHRDWSGKADLISLRDKALLLTAYDVGARRSELVAIEVEHVDHYKDGSGTLYIPRSKTDQEGEGAYAYLSPRTMRAIAEWQKAAQVTAGPLFRRIDVHSDGSARTIHKTAMHADSVTRAYRRLIMKAWDAGALPDFNENEIARIVQEITSHSVRVGVAQDNFAAGEDLPAIMQAYRWRDAKTVLRYGEKLAPTSGAAKRMAARVG